MLCVPLRYSVEISVVMWRQSWLSCILKGTDDQLNELKQQIHKARADNESTSDRTSAAQDNDYT